MQNESNILGRVCERSIPRTGFPFLALLLRSQLPTATNQMHFRAVVGGSLHKNRITYSSRCSDDRDSSGATRPPDVEIFVGRYGSTKQVKD